ncbi:MAG: hypothetical protein R2771_05745 [Saprospiraceae bacterium]
MAAPGAIVVSKILFPQTMNIDKQIDISTDNIGSNILDAIANGTTEGLKFFKRKCSCYVIGFSLL